MKQCIKFTFHFSIYTCTCILPSFDDFTVFLPFKTFENPLEHLSVYNH